MIALGECAVKPLHGRDTARKASKTPTTTSLDFGGGVMLSLTIAEGSF
jgi:hypothetical protein